MDITQSVHWAALMETATSGTGSVNSHSDIKDDEILYGPVTRAFGPQFDGFQPIQPADLLKSTWNNNGYDT